MMDKTTIIRSIDDPDHFSLGFVSRSDMFPSPEGQFIEWARLEIDAFYELFDRDTHAAVSALIPGERKEIELKLIIKG